MPGGSTAAVVLILPGAGPVLGGMSALEGYLAAKAKLRPVSSTGRMTSLRGGSQYDHEELSAKSRIDGSSALRGSARARARRKANASLANMSYDFQDVSFAGSVSSCFAATLRPESRAAGPIKSASGFRQPFSAEDPHTSLLITNQNGSGSLRTATGRPTTRQMQEAEEDLIPRTSQLESSRHSPLEGPQPISAPKLDRVEYIEDISACSSTPKTVVPPMPRWNSSMRLGSLDDVCEKGLLERAVESMQFGCSPRRDSQSSGRSEGANLILDECDREISNPLEQSVTLPATSESDKLAEISNQLSHIVQLQQRILASPTYGRVPSPTRANIDDNRMSAVQEFMVALDEKITEGSAAVLSQLVDLKDMISASFEQIRLAFKSGEENTRSSVSQGRFVMEKRVEQIARSFEEICKTLRDRELKLLQEVNMAVERTREPYQTPEKGLSSLTETKIEDTARRVENIVQAKQSPEPQNKFPVDIIKVIDDLHSNADSLSARTKSDHIEIIGQLLKALYKRLDGQQADQAAFQRTVMEAMKGSDSDRHRDGSDSAAAMLSATLSEMETRLRTWITTEVSRCLNSGSETKAVIHAAAQTQQEVLDNVAVVCHQIKEKLEQTMSSAVSARWQTSASSFVSAATDTYDGGPAASKTLSAVVRSQERLSTLDASVVKVYDLLVDFRDRVLVNMRAEQGGNLCIQSKLSDIQRACERMTQCQERLVARMQGDLQQSSKRDGSGLVLACSPLRSARPEGGKSPVRISLREPERDCAVH